MPNCRHGQQSPLDHPDNYQYLLEDFRLVHERAQYHSGGQLEDLVVLKIEIGDQITTLGYTPPRLN